MTLRPTSPAPVFLKPPHEAQQWRSVRSDRTQHDQTLHAAHASGVRARLLPITSPYVVLPAYWTREKTAAAREQVLRAMSLVCSDKGEGGDNRSMGVSTLVQGRREYNLITAFQTDERLLQMAAAHLHTGPHAVKVSTLAGSTAVGQASGGGWHKDSLQRGVKALIYLDDVLDVGVGPFAMLLNYSDTTLRYDPRDYKHRRTRFTDEAVRSQVARGAQVSPVLGVGGTVVLFETSSVHRGMPALSRGRVSLTNYYQNSLRVCGARTR